MKISLRTGLLAILLAATGTYAAITDVAEGGFTTVHTVIVGVNRQEVWAAAIEDIGKWWNPDHTVSGDASRLSIKPVPQGCFCERFGAGAGVVHLTVTMVNPGVVMRLTGGLGPLGLMGVSGNMTWEFDDVEGGTRVTFTYAVGGYHPQGLDSLAESVDSVIGEALIRLKAHIESGDPGNADLG